MDLVFILCLLGIATLAALWRVICSANPMSTTLFKFNGIRGDNWFNIEYLLVYYTVQINDIRGLVEYTKLPR